MSSFCNKSSQIISQHSKPSPFTWVTLKNIENCETPEDDQFLMEHVFKTVVSDGNPLVYMIICAQLDG
jgi:hypothetical protein